MDIFKRLVPYVAFWIPNGVEKVFTCDEGEAVKTEYGLSIKVIKKGKTIFFPVYHKSDIHEGEKFKSYKLICLRQYGYKHRKNGELFKVPVEFRYDGSAFITWRVAEIYK